MLDWLLDHPWIIAISLFAIVLGLFVWLAQSEGAYKSKLLAGAHTYADTLAVEQIMAQRATAIAFGAALVAGSHVRYRVALPRKGPD